MGGLVKITRPFTDGMKNATTLPTHAIPAYWVDIEWSANPGVVSVVANASWDRKLLRTYSGEARITISGPADPGNWGEWSGYYQFGT